MYITGPPETPFYYTLPWSSGTSVSDSLGYAIIQGTALEAGTWPFTVIFPEATTVSKTFLVMDYYTAPDGFDGQDADADSDGDADGDGDGDGGDGSGDGDGGDGGDGGGGGGGGGAM